MGAHDNILLVGSVGLEDAESVFGALATRIGERAKRYPDGETGARGYWIRWQQEALKDNPQFELYEAARKIEGYKDEVKRSFFRIADGVDADDIAFGALGYAKFAVQSYAIFERLKSEGVVPASTRFQVCLPTALALASCFIVLEDRLAVEAAYERAIGAEIETITGAIPHDQLAIQWDIVYELVGQDGGYEIYFDDIIGGSVERICRQAGYVPEAVELGFHLCYGDPGHQHILEPEDTGTAVAYVNAIGAAAPRRIDWFHLPVPRERTDDGYYRALAGMTLPPETDFYLGLVHFTDGEQGSARRIEVAEKFLSDFGIATECGFGRREPETIPDLLDLHRRLADR